MPYNKSMKDYISTIATQGGMALSNGYIVNFTFDTATGVKSVIDQLIPGSELYTMFCDEAQLPSSQAATGQVTGMHLGEGRRSYAHTKMYTDLGLGWMCDANMEPYKFVQAWWQYMFPEYDANGEIDTLDGQDFGATYSTMLGKAPKSSNRATRLRYPSDYYCTIKIAKAEKGPNGEVERVSSVHILQDAFPYSVDSVPLSFGQSQLSKVTAKFYYSKHRVVYNDNRSVGSGKLLAQQFLDSLGNLNLGSSNVA